ncbi:MAG: hypothetical protein KGJ28_11300 [Alphaproteobacteria bacterium]|nr:hypothetical protein [Alphaproteobacteria bacterium]
MDRHILAAGFLKIFVPLVYGYLAAAVQPLRQKVSRQSLSV